jgi:general stress protein 26
MSTTPAGASDDLGRLRELLSDLRFAMVTTRAEGGHLHSRPLTAQELDHDGVLWFLVNRSADWLSDVVLDPQVNVAFSAPEDQRWVSISARATIVDDRQRILDLWTPFVGAWFPGGPEDPDVTLLRADIEQAAYWDAPSGTLTRMAGIVAGMLTGHRPPGGDHGQLQP